MKTDAVARAELACFNVNFQTWISLSPEPAFKDIG